MNNRYNYHFDRRAKLITSVAVTVAVLAALLVGYYARGGYFMAWFISLVAGVAGLCILSVPRYILVGEGAVEIHCVLELTTIRYEDLVSVRRVRRSEMKYCFPLFGSYGFFGYYGYYYNLRYWDMVRVYAGSWSRFVEIEDIYEQKYVVSCTDADELVAAIRAAIAARAQGDKTGVEADKPDAGAAPPKPQTT